MKWQKVRQILIDSYKGAVSSEETFAEVKMESNENTSKSGFWGMWESVCQFKATTCFAVSGKDQIHDLLPRTTSKELQKDEKDAAKKTAHAIILNAATSASDAKTKVARILKLVGEVSCIYCLKSVELRSPSFTRTGSRRRTAFLP